MAVNTDVQVLFSVADYSVEPTHLSSYQGFDADFMGYVTGDSLKREPANAPASYYLSDESNVSGEMLNSVSDETLHLSMVEQLNSDLYRAKLRLAVEKLPVDHVDYSRVWRQDAWQSVVNAETFFANFSLAQFSVSHKEQSFLVGEQSVVGVEQGGVVTTTILPAAMENLTSARESQLLTPKIALDQQGVWQPMEGRSNTSSIVEEASDEFLSAYKVAQSDFKEMIRKVTVLNVHEKYRVYIRDFTADTESIAHEVLTLFTRQSDVSKLFVNGKQYR
ncbi:hypothetical protein [Pleionea sp. CnH1-48]|uniref:hypothetical protein n=1 Tax=Pleionea sp. CnH1-48 TaxID=2954494 RepID=UPI0020985BC3|nr:hypothetical protein [Pleionea sp. CnH1-48]MCO7223708.1 hypothetical protein [Pleionea sp. CnH1-48]